MREEENLSVLRDLKNFPSNQDHIYEVSDPLHGVDHPCEINVSVVACVG